MERESVHTRRLIGWTCMLFAAVLLLGGCNAFNRKVPPTAPPPTAPAPIPPLTLQETASPTSTRPPTASPGKSPAAGPTGVSRLAKATPQPGDFLFARTGFGAGSQGITIINAATGIQAGDLPAGVPSPDWSVLYTADDQDGATTVKALDPRLGAGAAPLRQRLIQGDYQVVAAGFSAAPDGASAGLSPNGNWLVLAGRPDAATQGQGGFGRNAGTSDRFVVLDTAFTGYARGVILTGQYRFFAIGDDGNSLYLLETATGGQGRFQQQVRIYDLKKPGLLDKPLSDQAGDPVLISQGAAGAASPDGRRVYSVSINPVGGQVLYTMDLQTQAVQRTDLSPMAIGSSPFQIRSSLLAAPDGKTLYVVNSSPPAVFAVDSGGLQMRGSITLSQPPASQPPATLPEVGQAGATGSAGTPAPRNSAGGTGRTGAPGGLGTPFAGGTGRSAAPGGANNRRFSLRNAALSPDGSRLYVPGFDGLAVLDTNGLSMAAFYLPGMAVDEVAVSADGRRLYALSSQLGKLISVNAQTGETIAQLDAPGGATALLHVVTNP